MQFGSNDQVSGTYSSSTGQSVVLYVYTSTAGACNGGTPLTFIAVDGSGPFSFVSGNHATYFFFATTQTPDTVSISGTFTGPLLLL
jgi:hypothetical protein